jgi:hypothetical protein
MTMATNQQIKAAEAVMAAYKLQQTTQKAYYAAYNAYGKAVRAAEKLGLSVEYTYSKKGSELTGVRVLSTEVIK